MERTLEVMMEELRLVREERKPLSEAIGKIDKKISNLNKEIETYKLNNGLYHPMSELANYKGKYVRSIDLVERDEDGTLRTDFMYDDDIFEIDNNGHLYYSSYEGGITEFDDEAKKYVHMYYGYPTYHDYVGFTEIKIRD